MMRLPRFEYRAARTVMEALDWMGNVPRAGELGPEARAMFMAGGTDLLPNMKHRIFTPILVVGLSSITTLTGIAYDGELGLRVGAGVRLADLAADSRVRDRYPALAQAAEAISTPQLRQMGTVGGNLCLDTRCNYYNQSEFWRRARDYCLKKGSDVCRVAPGGTGCYAVSSCDTAPVLIAYGATVRVASRQGDRVIPVSQLFHDDGIHPVRLQPGEVLTDVFLPVADGDVHSVYAKYRVRGSFDFPIASVAVVARFQGDICLDARLVLQGIDTAPVSLPSAESLLSGTAWTPDLLEEAATLALREAHPMDNTSGTISLRRRIIQTYTRRALSQILGETGESMLL
jgi:4-hydroxybenzoyl-CoA reductase subunit beta